MIFQMRLSGVIGVIWPPEIPEVDETTENDGENMGTIGKMSPG
jgi:hypothetical protein